MRRLRFFAFLLCAITLVAAVAGAWGVQVVHGAPSLQSPRAVLLDFETGDIIYEKRATEVAYPASTTKVVTALTVLERYEGSLDDLVTVSSYAASIDGSSAYILPGQQIPLRTLLIAVMMMSGNDAAVAVAEHVGGSVAGFAQMMNEVAREAGATQSNFRNPHGLPDINHTTTVLDMARITAYAYERHPFFEELARTRSFEFPWLNGVSTSHNRFMAMIQGADGVKTGWTNASQATLVGSLMRNDNRLIGVIFGGPTADTVAREMVSLMEFGLERLAVGNLVDRGQLVTYLPVSSGEATDVPAITGGLVRNPLGGERFEQAIVVDKLPEAPIEAGDAIGMVQYFVDGEYYREIPLLAASTVEADADAAFATAGGVPPASPSIWQTVLKIFLWAVGVFLAYIVLGVGIRWYRLRRRRRRYRFYT